MTTELRGITWNHSRALPPLVATAQRFEEQHPDVRIRWEKRSLHEFGHADVKALAENFDLIVLDHPWIGYAFAHGCLLPLQEGVPQATRNDWERNSVGGSFASYEMDHHLWAVPIDAATPTAAARMDLLDASSQRLPSTWDEVLELSRRGLVAIPAFPTDLLLHLLMLCASHEPDLFVLEDHFAPPDLALAQMERLRELVTLLPESCYQLNPIGIFEWMAEDSSVAYCPFAYAYSNYARPGFGRGRITFHDLPKLAANLPLRSVLGGTGLAISSRCSDPSAALQYLTFTASGAIQTTLYTAAGGQPAHLQAWLDQDNNQRTGNFFHNTLPAMERAWMRPRYYGYPFFQEQAGIPLQAWIRTGGSARDCLETMNELYRQSRALQFPSAVR